MNLRINLKVISLILGIVLWAYVNLVISPVIRRTVKSNIEFKNIPPKIKISPQTNEVELVLNGTRRDFIFSGKGSIQASVDLYSLRPGAAFFPLKVSTPSGLSVVAMNPSQIEVYGEPLVSRKMELTIDIKGQVAEGFIADAPVASPTEVILEGPRELIDKVTNCQVSIPISDLKNSIIEDREIVIFGTSGEIKSGLSVFPPKVKVSLTVKAGYPHRMATIVPQFINKPPEGYKLGGFSVEPKEIMLTGPQRVLETLPNIRTLPIDLSLLHANSNIIALLDPPPFENVKIVGSNTVSLNITLEAVPVVKTFTGLQLTLKNSPNQLLSVSPASYTLVVKGFIDDLNKVSTADLGIVLDVRDLAPGSYPRPLPCPSGLPDKLEILEIIPPKVNIQVSSVVPENASGTSEKK